MQEKVRKTGAERKHRKKVKSYVIPMLILGIDARIYDDNTCCDVMPDSLYRDGGPLYSIPVLIPHHSFYPSVHLYAKKGRGRKDKRNA